LCRACSSSAAVLGVVITMGIGGGKKGEKKVAEALWGILGILFCYGLSDRSRARKRGKKEEKTYEKKKRKGGRALRRSAYP